MKTKVCYETHMHCHGDYCDQVNAYVDRERKELAAALREANELMPLGTEKRANWVKRTSELLAKL